MLDFKEIIFKRNFLNPCFNNHFLNNMLLKVGLSRSTTGCVAACLFREFQLTGSYEGLVETVPGDDKLSIKLRLEWNVFRVISLFLGVNLELLKMDAYKIDMTKDALFRGEFPVVKDLFAAFPDGEASKRMCDKVGGEIFHKMLFFRWLDSIKTGLFWKNLLYKYEWL